MVRVMEFGLRNAKWGEGAKYKGSPSYKGNYLVQILPESGFWFGRWGGGASLPTQLPPASSGYPVSLVPVGGP